MQKVRSQDSLLLLTDLLLENGNTPLQVLQHPKKLSIKYGLITSYAFRRAQGENSRVCRRLGVPEWETSITRG